MLAVENIDLYYGAAQALRSVSLSATIGRVTCLLGRNGVGKTSLLRAIVGLQPIASGSIALEDQEISSCRPTSGPARRGAGAAGPRDFPVADGEGESRDRLRASRPRAQEDPRRGVRTLSRC